MFKFANVIRMITDCRETFDLTVLKHFLGLYTERDLYFSLR